ncbi:hypothetical protein ACFX13_020320 [Malus domestica]
MNRDREANTRYVASSLEVLFLHPWVVSLTDEDAQGVPQVTELGDLSKKVTDKVSSQTSKQATQDRRFDFGFRLIVLLLLVSHSAARIRRSKWRRDDMRYFFF